MAILRHDLTERESRAEDGDAPGRSGLSSSIHKGAFQPPRLRERKGQKAAPPMRAPARWVPSPSAASPPYSSSGSASPGSPNLSISILDAAQKIVGVAPAINWSCPSADLGGPLQGGSGEEEKQPRLEACTRGSETKVISAAPVWEPETLARTIGPTRWEEVQGGQLPWGGGQFSPLRLFTSDLIFSYVSEGHFPPSLFPSLLHLRRV